MFEKIINNLINGNIKDFKKQVKKLSLNERYNFLLIVKNDYNDKFDYCLYVIVNRDF